jgi:hypothetical protein
VPLHIVLQDCCPALDSALQHFDNAIAACDSASNDEKERSISLLGENITVAAFLAEQREIVSQFIKYVAGNVYVGK